MSTPKAMKREELPPVPKGYTAHKFATHEGWYLRDEDGYTSVSEDSESLRSVAAWLELANGLTPPSPPIASELPLQVTRVLDALDEYFAARREMRKLKREGTATNNAISIAADEEYTAWVRLADRRRELKAETKAQEVEKSHSKSEYKRLVAQGANVAPPEDMSIDEAERIQKAMAPESSPAAPGELPNLPDGWEWNINGVGCDSAMESGTAHVVYLNGTEFVIESDDDDCDSICSCPAEVARAVLEQGGLLEKCTKPTVAPGELPTIGRAILDRALDKIHAARREHLSAKRAGELDDEGKEELEEVLAVIDAIEFYQRRRNEPSELEKSMRKVEKMLETIAYPPPRKVDSSLSEIIDRELERFCESMITDTLTESERIRIARERIVAGLAVAPRQVDESKRVELLAELLLKFNFVLESAFAIDPGQDATIEGFVRLDSGKVKTQLGADAYVDALARRYAGEILAALKGSV